MCAVLDSSILWLRHNLRKKLEVNCYLQVPILLSTLYPDSFADFLAFPPQSMRKNVPPGDFILTETRGPTRHVIRPAVLSRPGLTFAPQNTIGLNSGGLY